MKKVEFIYRQLYGSYRDVFGYGWYDTDDVRRYFMIQITEESLDKLLALVDEGKEVHIEFTPEETRVEVMPWKPFVYTCPYKGGGQE